MWAKIWYFVFSWRPSWIWHPLAECATTFARCTRAYFVPQPQFIHNQAITRDLGVFFMAFMAGRRCMSFFNFHGVKFIKYGTNMDFGAQNIFLMSESDSLTPKKVNFDTKHAFVASIQAKIWHFVFSWRPSWIWHPLAECATTFARCTRAYFVPQPQFIHNQAITRDLGVFFMAFMAGRRCMSFFNFHGVKFIKYGTNMDFGAQNIFLMSESDSLTPKKVNFDTKHAFVASIQAKIWHFVFSWRPSWIWPPSGVSPKKSEMHPSSLFLECRLHLGSTLKLWSGDVGHGIHWMGLY